MARLTSASPNVWVCIRASGKRPVSISRIASAYARESTLNAPTTVSALLMIRSVDSSAGWPPFSPASTTRPPHRTAASASRIGCAAIGVSSSATSAPTPPVTSSTRSTVSSASTSMHTSAPNSLASASFPASRDSPVTMIVPAPATREASTAARPRWPAPRISTVSPSPTPPR